MTRERKTQGKQTRKRTNTTDAGNTRRWRSVRHQIDALDVATFDAIANTKSPLLDATMPRLTRAADRFGAELKRSFRLASQPEGCVADDRTGLLFMGEEDRGVWVADADASRPAVPRMVLPVGDVLHTGDFKLDPDVGTGAGIVSDLERVERAGKEGVLLLISDSTNAERPGHTPSEAVIAENLEEIIKGCRGRVFLTTFASNVHRIQNVLHIAHRQGRRVVMEGRSMLKYAQVAQQVQTAVRAEAEIDDRDVRRRGRRKLERLAREAGERAVIEVCAGAAPLKGTCVSGRPVLRRKSSVSRWFGVATGLPSS